MEDKSKEITIQEFAEMIGLDGEAIKTISSYNTGQVTKTYENWLILAELAGYLPNSNDKTGEFRL